MQFVNLFSLFGTITNIISSLTLLDTKLLIFVKRFSTLELDIFKKYYYRSILKIDMKYDDIDTEALIYVHLFPTGTGNWYTRQNGMSLNVY